MGRSSAGDYFIKRKDKIDVAELCRSPQTSAYGDVNWAGMVAFFAGLVARWSVQDGLIGALEGPISINLLGGADLSWLFGIGVAGLVYLGLGKFRDLALLHPSARRRQIAAA